MHNSPTYLAKVSIHLILFSQFNHNLNTKKKKKECTLVNKIHIHNNNNATAAHSWCDDHSISISTCKVCGAEFKYPEGNLHIYSLKFRLK